MSSDPSAQETRSVTEGPVTVTKSFEAEEFPVPAVKFVIESDASEPVSIRLADSIPEPFPMENVGFHPDFEKDNWTAYKSHRVEYDRTLDPGESTVTVYGVRLDDTDVGPDAFLTEPTLARLDADEVGTADEAIDDVLGEDSNQLVRDVLSGERDGLPGLGEENGVDAPDLTMDAAGGEPNPEDITLELNERDAGGDDTADASDAPRPDAFDGSGASATEAAARAVVAAVDEPDVAGAEGETGTEPQEDLDLNLDLDDDGDSPAETESETAADTDVAIEDAEHAGGPRVTAGSVVAALATELEREDADSDDVATLREALGTETGSTDGSVPRSVDLRIERLQSQVEDLAAYSAGLEAFLDEEGTAEELIEGFRADVHEMTDTVDELSAAVDAAEADRDTLHGDVNSLQSGLSGVDDRIDSLEGRFDETTDRLDRVDDRHDETTERLDSVEDRFEEMTERLDRVDDRHDETTGRLDSVEDRFEEMTERLDRVDDRLGAIDERFDDLADQAAHADETAERLDEEMGEVRDELAALDGDITAAHEAIEEETAPVREDVADLREELADLDETVAEFRAFRDRLSNALGPMVGGGPGGDAGEETTASAESGGENGDEVESAGENDDEPEEGEDADEAGS
jgi:predicted  nucleic acid-binding Zn-ribbon protein